MPSLFERLFAAGSRLCAALVACVPLAVAGVLLWAAIANAARGSSTPSADLDWSAIATFTVIACVGAAAIGGGIGVGTALAVRELASGLARHLVEAAIALFASVPAIAIGWFAAIVVAPFAALRPLGGATPLVAAVAVLSAMVAPTAGALVTRSLRGVPDGVRHAAAAAGATRLQTTTMVVAPGLGRRVAAAVLAAFARAAGEATVMAVVFLLPGFVITRDHAPAAGAAFLQLIGRTGASVDGAAYTAALAVMMVAAGCAAIVAREFGGEQWAR